MIIPDEQVDNMESMISSLVHKERKHRSDLRKKVLLKSTRKIYKYALRKKRLFKESQEESLLEQPSSRFSSIVQLSFLLYCIVVVGCSICTIFGLVKD